MRHRAVRLWLRCSWMAVAILFAMCLPLTSAQGQIAFTLNTTPLEQPSTCTDQFVAHDLDYMTETGGREVHLYDSNGSGVAVGDLNGDGKLDIVFANLNGPDTILWNEGNFTFRKEQLKDQNSRAVNIVDVDGDGRLDIVFTHSVGALTYWHNDGALDGHSVHFSKMVLPDIRYPAYVMAWADVDGDGRLDVVTGSYDPDLERSNPNSFLFGGGVGVVYYHQTQSGFEQTRLTKKANALAILLEDLWGDGHTDLVIGNDYGLGNPVWEYQDAGWKPLDPFQISARDTMSLDLGDIDNSGRLVLFAADMKPYETDTPTLTAWKPILDSLKRPVNSNTIAENVLLVPAGNGTLINKARDFGVDATGWTWSAQFGDLDNDGYLDLYAVNGMQAVEMFRHQPENTLIEQHQAFRNTDGKSFTLAPEWQLNAREAGRGMVMADLNNDGKLDIVVNNLNEPAQLFENQLCGGNGLEVDLAWVSSLNTHALGASLTLKTSTGTYYRQVRSSSGYLAGNTSRTHFGFPAASQLLSLEVRWPDGVVSTVDHPTPQTLVTIQRN